MAKIDLKPLSLSELKSLHARIEKAISRHEKAGKKAALAELKKKAKALGFSLDDLVATPNGPAKRKPAKKSAPLPPRFRDPAKPENTWSGRGPRPVWLREALASGKKLEDFEIKA
jgi:DNA-binding protein H-NS